MPVVIENENGHQLFAEQEAWPWWRNVVVGLIEWLDTTFLPPAPGFICYDCEEYGHGWMVNDEVWEQICESEGWSPENPYVIYCCECAEKRLGRQLTLADFTDVPINRPLRFGFQLGVRQAREAGRDRR